MNLPLTSLVPTVVEITSFIERNWPHVWWFPNWYLGVPLRFVTGPVVPAILIFFHKIFPISLETIYLLLVGTVWLCGGLGTVYLVKALGGGKKTQWLAGIVFTLLPFHLFLLATGTGLHHLVVALMPWVFIACLHAFKSWKWQDVSLTVIGTALVILIDVAGILPLVVGFISLAILNKREDLPEKLIKLFLILLTALSLVTIWYTPRFWWTLLNNPSFAGKPLANVIPFVLQLIEALLPLILGWWVVKKRYSLKQPLIRFGVLFGSSFLFLTLIRFLSDVDFWIDWTGYFLELQLALALFLPWGILKLVQDDKKRWFVFLFIIFILTISNGIMGWVVFIKDADKVTEYKKSIVKLV